MTQADEYDYRELERRIEAQLLDPTFDEAIQKVKEIANRLGKPKSSDSTEPHGVNDSQVTTTAVVEGWTDVRVRFAPSPTGYLHLGGARTALFNWLFARKHGGVFILRIEDTDIQRSSEEMVQGILDGMHWLGLDPDEGPFFQSSFLEQHRAAARRLVEEGKAYYDFTPKEQTDDRNVRARIVDRARAQAGTTKEPNPFRDLPLEEALRRAASGESAAIRLKVPDPGVSRFDDLVYGPQERDHSDIEDLVLIRSDGHPLYNLSVVVDDIEMRITHVIRGQDHLTNTHKQVLIYEALEAPVPQFAHLPLIMAPGREKLSKRKHGEVVSVTTYRDRGFVRDALVNYLALLGWSPGSDQEMMSRQELIEKFSLEAVNKASAIFNFNEKDPRDWTDPKALWMNGEYLRAMPLDELVPLVGEQLKKFNLWREEYDSNEREWLARTIDLLRARYRTTQDFTTLGRPYFTDEFEYEPDAVKKNLKDERLKALLHSLADQLASLDEFTHDATESAVRAHAQEQAVKAGLLINAARTALTGQSVGPGMFDIMVTLGRRRTVERLRRAAAVLA
ncbi:MAG TPA: glutamate--tRNA ligase [Blastocatellia bacterium]|nr:glutamate--tRNA ligase [Blastocatellia bacterium]